MNIIVVGETIPGSRTPQRVQALRSLGHNVSVVSSTPDGATYEQRPSVLDRLRYRLRIPADIAGANGALLAAITAETDVVWVENARIIRKGTLKAVTRAAPRARLVWFSEDDTMNHRHRTVWMDGCIPLYDLWVTTKSFNAAPHEVPSLGARRVLFVHNSYDPQLHRPTPPDPAFAADVAFVGTFEAPRANSLLRLAQAGMQVRVWGNGWERMAGRHPNLVIEGRPVYDGDYAKVCGAAKINLCFLRKFNRDLQTCRSVELPAIGVFMLHERNQEIVDLFAEEKEAVYFGDDDELIAQVRRWLPDNAGRRRIAAAARQKTRDAGLSHGETAARILAALDNAP